MNFTNPYPHTEHEVYSQTFLQTVSANIRFSSSDTQAEYWQKFREFSKQIFHIPVTDIPSGEDQYAELSSSTTETTYSFKGDTATVAIGPKGYRSFGETMPVHFCTIQTFLQDVVPSFRIQELSLTKRNRFPFHISLDRFDLKDALNYVFKPEHTEDLEKYRLEKGKQIKVTKEAQVDLDHQARMQLTIGFQVMNDSNVHLLFDLHASYVPSEGMEADKLYSLASELNDIMFDAFRYVVTENIIHVLRGEN